MSTRQTEEFSDELAIPEGVTVTLNKHMLHFAGPLGKTHKSFRSIPVDIKIAEGKILLSTINFKKRDYAILHTARSIIRNICEGLVTGIYHQDEGGLFALSNYGKGGWEKNSH